MKERVNEAIPQDNLMMRLYKKRGSDIKGLSDLSGETSIQRTSTLACNTIDHMMSFFGEGEDENLDPGEPYIIPEANSGRNGNALRNIYIYIE